MPILWRFLLGEYIKIFLLSLLSIISVLLVTRLDEIAHFATLGAPWLTVLQFTLYQIVYILPIAFPISSLLGATLLYQRLSETQELTAMRTSGISLRRITAPVLLTSLLLSCLNFYIVSEQATRSHLLSRQLFNETKSINPLLLIQNKQLARIKDAYVDMGALYGAETAHDVIIAFSNKSSQRIHLINAKKLLLSDDLLHGEDLSIISNFTSDLPYDYDHLLIENHRKVSTPSNKFSQFMRSTGWRLSNDHLQLPLLLAKAEKERKEIKALKRKSAAPHLIDGRRQNFHRTLSEISRRFSSATAVFTFALLGSAFGISIGRRPTKRGTVAIISLAALFLICFFSAKSFDRKLYLASTLYLLPHPIIALLSIATLRRVTKGIES